MTNTKITIVGLLPAKKKGQFHVVGRIGGMDFSSMTPKTIEELSKDLGEKDAALKKMIRPL